MSHACAYPAIIQARVGVDQKGSGVVSAGDRIPATTGHRGGSSDAAVQQELQVDVLLEEPVAESEIPITFREVEEDLLDVLLGSEAELWNQEGGLETVQVDQAVFVEILGDQMSCQGFCGGLILC